MPEDPDQRVVDEWVVTLLLPRDARTDDIAAARRVLDRALADVVPAVRRAAPGADVRIH